MCKCKQQLTLTINRKSRKSFFLIELNETKEAERTKAKHFSRLQKTHKTFY